MTYYHNLTKLKFNITDLSDFGETIEEGDKLAYTRSGSAIVELIDSNEDVLKEVYEVWNKL